jgi:hypothetical protein
MTEKRKNVPAREADVNRSPDKEDWVDEIVEETFPASDPPPFYSGRPGDERNRRPTEKDRSSPGK